LAHLERLEPANNTIVVFTSDHGDMLFSHGRLKKQQPWEEAIRIPFIISWPGFLPEGKVERTIFSSVDMAPTLLGLL
jgi:arylsulfatase A-like enzyme